MFSVTKVISRSPRMSVFRNKSHLEVATYEVPILCVLLLLSSVSFADELTLAQVTEMIKALTTQVTETTQALTTLTTQVQLQQFHSQERIRSEGNSGIKQVRIRHSGINNYNTETHVGGSIAAMHTHSNFVRTVGMGEFIGVLNGVEFRTRHNDYHLVMPSTTSKELHKNEDIPFPDVPPEVLAKTTIEEQIVEMNEFFKAFKNQNNTHRNYTKYFKPILCYMEGAWFKVKQEDPIVEPFHSARHSLDADSFQQLHDRAQFMAYSGSKSRLENLASLPTAFIGKVNGTRLPQLAQFNYRILCHPMKKDLPLNHLHVVENLSSRFFKDGKRTMAAHEMSRMARFQLNVDRSDETGGQYANGLLDEIMSEIPGKDNYPGNIKTSAEADDAVLKMGGNMGPINQAYYHRYYKLKDKDAMGLDGVHRTFSDDFGFAARTTNEEIVGMDYPVRCFWDKSIKRKVCPPPKHEKWSWAVPIEIIYLTPLQSWNPHNITLLEGSTSVVTESGKRNGGCSTGKAYAGAGQRHFFRTPAAFFSNDRARVDAADTVSGKVCVLDPSSNVVPVKASGVYLTLPDIGGVGPLRIRYPIMPVHGEGSSVSKELNAVRHLLMNREGMDSMIYTGPKMLEGQELQMSDSRVGNLHTHKVDLSAHKWTLLMAGHLITAETTQTNGHTHALTIKLSSKGTFYYKTCDNKKECGDRHRNTLTVVKKTA